MTEADRDIAPEAPPAWLTPAEQKAWLSLTRLMTWLPLAIDEQLRRDAKLSLVEYQVLAVLSESPRRTMRMSSVAEIIAVTLSRLSHVAERLERRGLMRREPDPTDGRFTNAILTENGFQTLAEAAPGHVAHVRSIVIDALSPERLRRLARDADRILSRLDKPGIS